MKEIEYKFSIGEEVVIIANRTHFLKIGTTAVITQLPTPHYEGYKLKGHHTYFDETDEQYVGPSEFRKLTKLERALK
jgi:hypothetical protein